MTTHPDTAALLAVVDRYQHLPVAMLHADSLGPIVSLATCEAWREACTIAGGKVETPGGSLSTAYRTPVRRYEHLGRDGVAVTHTCFPHMGCWRAS